MKKWFLAYWNSPQQWGKESERRRKRKFYKKKGFNKHRGENIKKHIITNQVLKNEAFQESHLVSWQKKTNYECWTYREVGHYTNECKNRKNSKLIETLSSLDYCEFIEEQGLALALKINKGIFKIVLEDKYEGSDYEGTSHMMKSSSISFGDL